MKAVAEASNQRSAVEGADVTQPDINTAHAIFIGPGITQYT